MQVDRRAEWWWLHTWERAWVKLPFRICSTGLYLVSVWWSSCSSGMFHLLSPRLLVLYEDNTVVTMALAHSWKCRCIGFLASRMQEVTGYRKNPVWSHEERLAQSDWECVCQCFFYQYCHSLLVILAFWPTYFIYSFLMKNFKVRWQLYVPMNW